jgi:hypothetical protein
MGKGLIKTLIEDRLKTNPKVDKEGYFARYQDNIFNNNMKPEHQDMFNKGDGNELKDKKAHARAVYSSSMLCYNFLSWIDDKHPFLFDEITYNEVRFEEQLPTLKKGVKRRSANLDVLLISEDEKNLLFIESKFTEYLDIDNIISESYNKKDNNIAELDWAKIIGNYHEKSRHYFGGIKQNICHLVALNNLSYSLNPINTLKIDEYKEYEKYKNKDCKIKFINLVFEPSIEFAKERYMFDDYRNLVDEFIKSYNDTIENKYVNEVGFVSYTKLWEQMKNQIPQERKDFLCERYLKYSSLKDKK